MTSRSSIQSETHSSSASDISVCTVSSIPSIPSIQVSPSADSTNELKNSATIPPEVQINAGENVTWQTKEEEYQTTTVSLDHERQVLLLFLLAQVCALHDPTPRTFTVHVLGLFEQGILDREAISFLFESGFVPSSTVDSRGLLLTTGNVNLTTPTGSTPARATTNARDQGRADITPIITNDLSDDSIDSENQEIEVSITTTERAIEMVASTDLAVVSSPTNVLHSVKSAVPGVTTLHSNETLRSLEASAIRRKLSQHDDLHHNSTKAKNERKKSMRTTKSDKSSPAENVNDSKPKPWDVKHFPLSISRYQREFKEIALLSSGSFGSVFRAVRELDGYEYAVKKITFDAMGYSNESIEQVIREVQCLAAVNDHPNIVRYYTSWWEPTWMTGSIPNKSRRLGHRKNIDNDSSAICIHKGNTGITGKRHQKQLLQIEAGDSYDKASPHDNETWPGESSRLSDAIEEWSASSSSSSSSSWSSESDDDYYSHDRSINSNREDNWENYHNQDLESWTKAYDDSYITKPAYRQRTHSTRKAKKNSSTKTPYQYQISLYIQMQLCHPANLQDWIRERNKQIPESDHERRIVPAVEIFQQICRGLAHIHKSNVVHRDLKPANIFVSSDGKVIKIGDFGLSKQLRGIVNHQHANAHHNEQSPLYQHSPSEKQTLINAVIPKHTGAPSIQPLGEYRKVDDNLTRGIGTASYAAPEQVQSKTYGTAVDIFSLGLIFLELVSCFETEHERLHNLQQCRYQRLPKWIDEYYPEISSTILACTRPNACDRPTADDLVDAGKIKSPRIQKNILTLQKQLVEKNKEIAEKNETIRNLHLEIAQLQALLVPKTSSHSRHDGHQS